MCQIGKMYHRKADQGVRAARLEHRPTHMEEGSKMKKIGFATLIASGLTAAVFGFAVPAQAQPASPVGPHYSVDNHDETNTSGGFVDLPF